MGQAEWPYNSTARARGLVLLALGVVKVATAEQLRQLVLPGTADLQTVRNACKDLRHAGLMESVGRTSSAGANGRPVRRDLWNLTTAGLSAAASELGRPVREMGGTARDAAKAGAAHALAVTDTIDAFRQSPPLPTKPVARRTTRPVPERVLPVRPRGLGHLRGWETEVALPVTGTFTTPARGSLRADAVLTAPEDQVPVLFVEVDNHTEPAAVVAAKIDRYSRFFRRQMKNDRGRDVALWSTLWDDSGRGGFPPVALVFTKDVGAQARMNRIKTIRDLSRTCWQPRWYNPHGWSSKDTEEDGWWDFSGTVPVIATHLDQLRAHGPHGPVWWRFGHSEWQPIIDALANTGTKEEYRARQDQHRQEREAARVVEQEQRREELARREATWECPSCESDVEPGTVGPDGYRPIEGGLCPACEDIRREAGREHQALEEAARNNGVLARLRARAGDR
ncbi:MULTISPECIES: replication-relaxation family protein [unclassified Streptomyces]|uniref:replication-relaxation family protein n=1 Tax=unclassified Streptomyces TaxID=2593676 RepID=UPI0029A98FCA|nr:MULTISPECIES: replication-relaxation family protein [unclassified Streptomyces]MDX3771748.1 replication-relaxation family protein [Streptomyces sp. AK08-01B]MDX3820807.1 replication-relaxation family protein [Streptomyces sp. AK08-01A]